MSNSTSRNVVLALSGVIGCVVLHSLVTSRHSGKLIIFAKKAAKSNELGDCPFTHKVLLLCAIKNIDIDIKLIDLSLEPSKRYLDYDYVPTFNNSWKGGVPALYNPNTKEFVNDSSVIVKYLEKNYGKTLGNAANDKNEQLAQIIKPLFGQMAQWVKNYKTLKESKDSKNEFSTNLLKTLDNLENFFRTEIISYGTTFLSGKPSIICEADIILLPQLYHIETVLDHLYEFKLKNYNNRFYYIYNYIKYCKSKEWWSKILYRPQTILDGWSKYF